MQVLSRSLRFRFAAPLLLALIANDAARGQAIPPAPKPPPCAAAAHRQFDFWIGGGLLQLDGGLSGASMVLEGDAFDADATAKIARQRITWTPQSGGVRQLWEASTDGGATWSIVFDGRYARAQK